MHDFIFSGKSADDWLYVPRKGFPDTGFEEWLAVAPDRAFNFFRHLALYLDHTPFPLVKKLTGFFHLTGATRGVILELLAKNGVNAYDKTIICNKYVNFNCIISITARINDASYIPAEKTSNTYISYIARVDDKREK